jgi:nucleoporin POM152
MDGTPRLRSAFPATPQTHRRGERFSGSPVVKRVAEKLPEIPALQPTAAPSAPSEPLIPESLIDAPSQRLYAVTIFVALWAWKVYDFMNLQESEEQSLWLFMKWVVLDGTFLFGLPGFRIPWLEWSSTTMTLLFMAHAAADGMMMFRIPIPIAAAVAAIGRSIWGVYEIAVNERSVNPRSIEFNESLILGRQIIHILPEGSAILNPNKDSFCIDNSSPGARLPITINATSPTSMDLVRIDLDTGANETIHIGKSQLKKMHQDAKRLTSYSEKPNEPKTLYHAVKKPGLYLLARVIDETNLEVSRKQMAHTVVVPCPQAKVLPVEKLDRCRGDVSDIELEVIGTPPLRVKYHKSVNQQSQEVTYGSIQPLDDYVSPLSGIDHDTQVMIPSKVDTEWAKPRKVRVPLPEGLGVAGRWSYSIAEVADGFGNKVSYSDLDQQKPSLRQGITVHELPTVNLQGCTAQNPLKVAKGNSAQLPVHFGSSGRGAIADAKYHIEYLFSPEGDMSETGDHSSEPQTRKVTVKDSKQRPVIQDAGLYTITGVSTDFCPGEVLEPASCLLQNPPEPGLQLREEAIFDKCAGSPIGLRVDLDLVGTPPFEIKYQVMLKDDRHMSVETEKVNGLRGQIELTPKHAGEYVYEFVEISDAVYKGQPLKGDGMKLKQDVKPAASASFVRSNEKKVACIDEKVSFDVVLQGEGPFTLAYEVVHNGKRSAKTIPGIDQAQVTIETDTLSDGGDYTLALTSVTDKAGCKEFLKDEVKVNVRHQKPKAGFGHIENRRSLSTLQGKSPQLPLRLAGEGPWTVVYKDADGAEQTAKLQHANDRITVHKEGTYELVNVHDAICPGLVDEAAKDFTVNWIPRPELRIPDTEIRERDGNRLIKADVCEGQEDSVEVLLKGSSPFHLYWTQHTTPETGARAPRLTDASMLVNQHTIRMDTSQAGLYKYTFDKLQDANYNQGEKNAPRITLEQRVHARPSAAFVNPGKTFSFCSVDSEGEEVIPIQLHGQPPFDLELEIKNQKTGKSDSMSLPNIPDKSYNIRIPHSRLQGGKSAIALRRVSDSRGCSRILDSTTPRVHIAVQEPPTITPLEGHDDFCVGDRINFALSGLAPFSVFYQFEGQNRKAVASSSTFRRLAEKPGTFVVTGVQDSGSNCRASTNITRHIHGMPSVRVSKGRDTYVDIHEGGEAEILFEFGGVPPFEFTYTRSSNTDKNGRKKGVILDMRHETSHEHSMRIKASEEGTYEVVAIRDRYCAYAKPGVNVDWKERQKMLQF